MRIPVHADYLRGVEQYGDADRVEDQQAGDPDVYPLSHQLGKGGCDMFHADGARLDHLVQISTLQDKGSAPTFSGGEFSKGLRLALRFKG